MITSNTCTICGGQFPEDKPSFNEKETNAHGNCRRIQQRTGIENIKNTPKPIPFNS